MGLLDFLAGNRTELDPLTGAPLDTSSGSGGSSASSIANALGPTLQGLGLSMLQGDRYNWFPNAAQNVALAQKMADASSQRGALRAILKEANPSLTEQQLDQLSSSPEMAKFALSQVEGTKADKAISDLMKSMPGFVGAGGAGGMGRGMAPTSLNGSGGRADIGTPNDIENKFIGTLRDGGLTNPFGLGAVAAYGRAESGYSPSNIERSWSDPSQSGQAGTSGGTMSWRNERLDAMKKATAGADDPVAAQARFMLSENPALTQALQNAQSPEEAHRLMADAWKFAGYDKPGGESANRLALTRSYADRFASADRPSRVAGSDPSYAPGSPPPRLAGLDGTATSTEAEVQAAERATSMLPGGAPTRAPGDTRMAMFAANDRPVMIPGDSSRTWTQAQARAYGRGAPSVETIATAQRAAGGSGTAQVAQADPRADLYAPGGAQTQAQFVIPGGNGRDPIVVPRLADDGMTRKDEALTNNALGKLGPQPKAIPDSGASTQRAYAIQNANWAMKALMVSSRLGDRGKGLAKVAEVYLDDARQYLKPVEIQRSLAAAGIDPDSPRGQQIQQRALPGQTDLARRMAEGGWTEGTPEYQAEYRRLMNADRTPMGYRSREDGSLEPIPGGPADPAIKGQEKAPVGYRMSADGTRMEFVPGGPHDPATETSIAAAKAAGHPKDPKPLPQNVIKSLSDAGSKVQDFNRFSGTFRDDYAGYGVKGIGGSTLGEIANTAGRNIPGSNYAPQAQWWQDYAQFRNQVRNSLFGSALTATEKAEFEKADIGPGMSPETIRTNLARQTTLAQGAARRMAIPHLSQGAPVGVVEGALGLTLGDLGIGASPQRAGQQRESVSPPRAREETPSNTPAMGWQDLGNGVRMRQVQ